MSKIHAIKRRIRSVQKVGQITSAMEKVAASKMRKAQEATLRSRTYATSAREVLAHLFLLTNPQEHYLFARRPIQRQLIIMFSSDRGLAGAYNMNVFRHFTQTAGKVPTKVIAVGKKGAQFVAKLDKTVDVVGAYTDQDTELSIDDVRPMVETALRLFREEKVDVVRLLYTDFISASRQQVVIKDLLPLDAKLVLGAENKTGATALFEPAAQDVLQYILPRLIEVQIYQAGLEAIASEQSMRMVAMKNASDNAGEITDDLTLSYNGARQNAITQELAEISVGAAASQF